MAKPTQSGHPKAVSHPGVWRLRAGADRRFRAGHPWVYSNELSESPKGIEPGAPVELRDAQGKFLARGYGNPASLIAFRAVSRDASFDTPTDNAFVARTLKRAGKLRETLGFGEVSYRLCFGEADRLPGLVIDRFVLANGNQVFVVQGHTAGADRWTCVIEIIFVDYVREQTTGPGWDKTGIIVKNDVGVRKLEGLTEEEPLIVKALKGVDYSNATIRVASATGDVPYLEFECNLSSGQKTGFFLDQVGNIQLAARRLAHLKPADGSHHLRILDLCTYVGQWSAQLARVYKAAGHDVQVLAVDSSGPALTFAKRNIEAQGASCEVLKGDVLTCLAQLEERAFDIVVCDPPALIKGRKDLPQGTHAYLQLNTQALRLVRKGGAVISCSCSALFEEENFASTLTKAAARGNVDVRWVARGSQGPDHPMLTEFPEGRYLKCLIGVVVP